MRRGALLLAAALLVACTQETPNGDDAPGEAPEAGEPGPTWPQPVVRELIAMGQADQRIRGTIASLIQSDPDTAQLQRATAEQRSIDQANGKRLRELIQEHGFPSKGAVGSEAAGAAFLVVQHAEHDLPFQKEYLTFLEREYSKGEAPGEAVAMLTDRTRLAQGLAQLYGTQANIKDGTLELQPLMDEDNVDQRRAMLGLVPLSEYLASLKQAYGLPD